MVVNQDPPTPPTAAGPARFRQGFRAPFSGLALLLKKGGLLGKGLAPLGIGTILTVAIAVTLISQYTTLDEWIRQQTSGAGVSDNLLRLQWWAIGPSLILSAISLGVILLVVLGNLFSSPWQMRLAAAAEDVLGPDPTRKTRAAPASAAEPMLAELGRIGGLVVVLALGLLLAWIPLIGSLLFQAYVLLVLVIFLATLFIGLPLRERGLSRWSKVRFVLRHKAAIVGFGLGLISLALIPLLQVACLPASAVGAVVLVRALRGSDGET